jgi:hypothetical protein
MIGDDGWLDFQDGVNALAPGEIDAESACGAF